MRNKCHEQKTGALLGCFHDTDRKEVAMTLSFTLTREGVEQQGERQKASKSSSLPSRFIKALKKKEDVSTCPDTTLDRWSNASSRRQEPSFKRDPSTDMLKEGVTRKIVLGETGNMK